MLACERFPNAFGGKAALAATQLQSTSQARGEVQQWQLAAQSWLRCQLPLTEEC